VSDLTDVARPSGPRRFRSSIVTARVAAGALLVALLAGPGVAAAEYADTLGYSALGRATGSAFVATPDVLDAFHVNPAGLLSRGHTFGADINFISLNPIFYRDAEGTHDERGRLLTNATLGYAATNDAQTFAYGLGFGVPFGLVYRFPNDRGFQRFAGSEAAIYAVAITPAVAVKLAPWISVGVGLNVIAGEHFSARATVGNGVVGDFAAGAGVPVSTRQPGSRQDGYVQIKSRREIDIPQPPDTSDVDFQRFSYTLGLQLTPRPDLRIGLGYREHTTIEYHGRINFFLDPDATLGGAITASERSTRVEFGIPRQLEAGISHDVLPQLELGLGVQWTNWSDAVGWGGRTILRIGGGGIVDAPALGIRGAIKRLVIPYNFHDTVSPRIGIRYRIAPGTLLLAGYRYDPTPVPTRSFDTLVSSANSHYATFGASRDFLNGALTLGAGAQFIVAEHRTIGEGKSFNAGGLGGLNFDPTSGTLSPVPNTAANNSGGEVLGGFYWTVGLNAAYRF
jgi:long-subunit fatty acid transport protein